MNNIEWKDGAVCYANSELWFVNVSGFYDNRPLVNEDVTSFVRFEYITNRDDFQLNEIREGDFIPASELDTEQEYNEVVEVFGLFGFERVKDSLSYSRLSVGATHYLASNDYGIDSVSNDIAFKNYCKGRQLTYSQIIAIGKLKRMMLEREDAKTQLEKWGGYAGKENAIKYNPDSMIIKDYGLVIAKPKRRNKSKQAYDILKSLDYEYDLVKQKWFRKEWV